MSHRSKNGKSGINDDSSGGGQDKRNSDKEVAMMLLVLDFFTHTTLAALMEWNAKQSNESSLKKNNGKQEKDQKVDESDLLTIVHDYGALVTGKMGGVDALSHLCVEHALNPMLMASTRHTCKDILQSMPHLADTLPTRKPDMPWHRLQLCKFALLTLDPGRNNGALHHILPLFLSISVQYFKRLNHDATASLQSDDNLDQLMTATLPLDARVERVANSSAHVPSHPPLSSPPSNYVASKSIHYPTPGPSPKPMNHTTIHSPANANRPCQANIPTPTSRIRMAPKSFHILDGWFSLLLQIQITAILQVLADLSLSDEQVPYLLVDILMLDLLEVDGIKPFIHQSPFNKYLIARSEYESILHDPDRVDALQQNFGAEMSTCRDALFSFIQKVHHSIGLPMLLRYEAEERGRLDRSSVAHQAI